MKRKLFCEISPLTYRISTKKEILMRKIRDLPLRGKFARVKQEELLPVRIKKHASLIRRRLGNVDMQLQENKAVNLSLAAPCIDRVLIRPGEDMVTLLTCHPYPQNTRRYAVFCTRAEGEKETAGEDADETAEVTGEGADETAEAAVDAAVNAAERAAEEDGDMIRGEKILRGAGYAFLAAVGAAGVIKAAGSRASGHRRGSNRRKGKG